MTEQHYKNWLIIRIAGPAIMFGVLFYVCWKILDLKMGTSFGIAGIMAAIDYFVLTWVSKRPVRKL